MFLGAVLGLSMELKMTNDGCNISSREIPTFIAPITHVGDQECGLDDSDIFLSESDSIIKW